ncbi:MAG: hypothetical protein RRA15_03675 [bacterium]|nr:hypothetical protein [bacterium]MDT8365575.1 hypothetical protein [bacterium]
MPEKKKAEKKMVTEDVENFFRDIWGKVVEYASLGAEEATKVSATAKTRVDIETLKFKRGKLLKMLGERYWDLIEKDSSLTVAGTGELLRQIKGIDKEVKDLEKEMTRKTEKAEKKASAKKAAPKKSSKKPAAAKKAASKKAPAAKKPAAKKPAAAESTPEETKGDV